MFYFKFVYISCRMEYVVYVYTINAIRIRGNALLELFLELRIFSSLFVEL